MKVHVYTIQIRIHQCYLKLNTLLGFIRERMMPLLILLWCREYSSQIYLLWSNRFQMICVRFCICIVWTTIVLLTLSVEPMKNRKILIEMYEWVHSICAGLSTILILLCGLAAFRNIVWGNFCGEFSGVVFASELRKFAAIWR